MPKKMILNTNPILPVITLVLLVPSLILNAYLLWYRERGAAGPEVKVVKVIDGDTFETEDKRRIRLRQVDAPETGRCGSEEATAYLRNLILGKDVLLEEEVYGQQSRPLALVYWDGRLINEEMLAGGLARYHHDNSSAQERLRTAGEKAKAEKIGIFGPQCYGTIPDDPQCVIKGNIDKSTETKIYYLPGCPQYDFAIVEKDIGEGWFCAPEEAEKAGFIKAKNCPSEKKSG